MWFDSLDKEIQDLLARYKLSELSKIEQSDVIIKVAPKISGFLAKQFDMQAVLRERAKLFNKDNDLAKFKKMIVVGKVKSYAKRWSDLASWDSLNEIITQKLNANEFSEYEFAQYALSHLEDTQSLQEVVHWCARAVFDPEVNNKFDHWQTFKLSEKIDHFNLIDLKSTQINGLVEKSVQKIDLD